MRASKAIQPRRISYARFKRKAFIMLRFKTNLALPSITVWSQNISRPGLPCFLSKIPRSWQAYHFMTRVGL